MANQKTDDLVSRLKNLGVVRTEWGADAGVYFNYHNGRVSMSQAREFFDDAVELAQEAVQVITALTKDKK